MKKRIALLLALAVLLGTLSANADGLFPPLATPAPASAQRVFPSVEENAGGVYAPELTITDQEGRAHYAYLGVNVDGCNRYGKALAAAGFAITGYEIDEGGNAYRLAAESDGLALLIVYRAREEQLTVICGPDAGPEPKRARVGDVLTFGRYEQDGNSGNGKEEIEWIVLAVEGNRALVIAQYPLDAAPYNKESEAVTWETCTLRAWLNGDFRNEAFTAAEQSAIVETKLSTEDNADTGAEGGHNTRDRVFCLSVEEAEGYFADDEARATAQTAYAQAARDDYYAEISWWWLRSPGDSNYGASVVYCDGAVLAYDFSVDCALGFVRPALWLNLASGVL